MTGSDRVNAVAEPPLNATASRARRGAGGRSAASCGARTAGSSCSSKCGSGGTARALDLAALGRRRRTCPRRPRACGASGGGTARRSRARPSWRRRRSPRVRRRSRAAGRRRGRRRRAPGWRSSSHAVAIEPRSSSSDGAAAVRRLDEREDRLGVHGHVGLGPLESVGEHLLVVVDDDPVVHPDDRAVADGMVVGLDRRVALRVVTDVDQRLGGVGRDLESGRAARSRRSAACGPRRAARACAYPTASAPRSAIPASSACAASVRSTALAALRLYPAIPHMLLKNPFDETSDSSHGRH